MNYHENIEHPDTHQFGDLLRKQLAMRNAEYKYLESKYDRVCSDLNSIINRVVDGEVVYIIMPNQEKVYLQRADAPTND